MRISVALSCANPFGLDFTERWATEITEATEKPSEPKLAFTTLPHIVKGIASDSYMRIVLGDLCDLCG